jgi:hypothetical protein
MQIEVLSTSVEDKGKYKQLEVAYKGGDGKVSSKKIMSFAAPDVFKILSSSKQGDAFDVTTVKNDKGYWDWTTVSQGSVGAASGSVKAAGSPAPRSTYETPEERANRQVLIVRQSSVSSAIEFYKLNAKKQPSVGDVVEVAKFFENYVFGKSTTPSSADSIAEMDDDIPL